MHYLHHHRQPSGRAPAQAIVEFALASTLIFFLLSAAIDLGLIFFTLQGLRTAAQEGATFGSYPVAVYRNGSTDVYDPANASGLSFNRVDLNYPEIIQRIYGSSGDGTTSGFADLHDLNNNDQDDMTENLYQNYSSANSFIRIENISSSSPPEPDQSYSACRGNVGGVGLQDGGRNCYIRVTVSYNYRLFFPFAPVLADTIRLRTSAVVPIRSSFYTS